MALIKAFAALRPQPADAGFTTAPPYDVISSDEAREMVNGNKYSFLRVEKPEVDFDRSVHADDERVYARAAANLRRLARVSMIQDRKPCLYIYRLTMNGAAQTGLVMCGSVDEYLSGAIKKHELTREDKERDRTRHIDAANANTEPIFLAYRDKDNPRIRVRLAELTQNGKPAYDFMPEDHIRHEVWLIDSDEEIGRLSGEFGILPAMYIADGHHRCAAAANVALERRKEDKNPNAEFNYTLSVVFPDTQLRIMDYNRVVKDLNDMSPDDLLSRISERFTVSSSDTPVKPRQPHEFGMYMDRKWRRLAWKGTGEAAKSLADALDVSILQNCLLSPILGIGDPRTDIRIDFIGGIRGLGELEKRVDSGGMAAAFSLFPTSMEQLMAIADAGEIMPPKSTWFEPKLRSGLFVHWLE